MTRSDVTKMLWNSMEEISFTCHPGERSDARVERTLLSVAFDVALDFDSGPSRPDPLRLIHFEIVILSEARRWRSQCLAQSKDPSHAGATTGLARSFRHKTRGLLSSPR